MNPTRIGGLNSTWQCRGLLNDKLVMINYSVISFECSNFLNFFEHLIFFIFLEANGTSSVSLSHIRLKNLQSIRGGDFECL